MLQIVIIVIVIVVIIVSVIVFVWRTYHSNMATIYLNSLDIISETHIVTMIFQI